MPGPLRFCIRSVTPQERRALEAAGAHPHDCIGACTDCFHGPVLARDDERVSEAELVEMLERGGRQAGRDADVS